MKIDIRQAFSDDAELIADLSRRTFYDTFASHNTKEDMDKFMNEQFTKEALIREAGAKGNIFFLAFTDNEPVGYARMRESSSPKELQKEKQVIWLGVWKKTSPPLIFISAGDLKNLVNMISFPATMCKETG